MDRRWWPRWHHMHRFVGLFEQFHVCHSLPCHHPDRIDCNSTVCGIKADCVDLSPPLNGWNCVCGTGYVGADSIDGETCIGTSPCGMLFLSFYSSSASALQISMPVLLLHAAPTATVRTSQHHHCPSRATALLAMWRMAWATVLVRQLTCL